MVWGVIYGLRVAFHQLEASVFYCNLLYESTFFDQGKAQFEHFLEILKEVMELTFLENLTISEWFYLLKFKIYIK